MRASRFIRVFCQQRQPGTARLRLSLSVGLLLLGVHAGFGAERAIRTAQTASGPGSDPTR